jgi:GR25 family glycosyltransferase involved in LPS biosynthesis
MPVTLGRQEDKVGNCDLRRLRSYQWGSAGYVLTPQVAEALLTRYRMHTDTVDGLLFRYPRRHQILQMVPALCIQRERAVCGSDVTIHVSALKEERATVIADSRRSAKYVVRQCIWRAKVMASISADIAMGYPYRSVPFSGREN